MSLDIEDELDELEIDDEVDELEKKILKEMGIHLHTEYSKKFNEWTCQNRDDTSDSRGRGASKKESIVHFLRLKNGLEIERNWTNTIFGFIACVFLGRIFILFLMYLFLS